MNAKSEERDPGSWRFSALVLTATTLSGATIGPAACGPAGKAASLNVLVGAMWGLFVGSMVVFELQHPERRRHSRLFGASFACLCAATSWILLDYSVGAGIAVSSTALLLGLTGRHWVRFVPP